MHCLAVDYIASSFSVLLQAFEDVNILDDCLAETHDDLSKALPLFTKKRAADVKALVQLSRGFDSTGLKQKLVFIAPIILDSISHKLAPKLFKPNTISYLQQEGISFSHVSNLFGYSSTTQ